MDVTDALGHEITEYKYDNAGRLTEVKDLISGAIVTKKYDPGNRIVEEIDPQGTFTKYSYHPQNGLLTKIERGKYLVDATGNLVLDSNKNPIVDTTVKIQTTTYEYNGTRTTVTDPIGRKTTSVVDEYYLPLETIYQPKPGQTYTTKTDYLYTNNLLEAKDYPTKVVDIGGKDRIFTYEQGRLKTARHWRTH